MILEFCVNSRARRFRKSTMDKLSRPASANGVSPTISSKLLFPSGSASVDPGGREALQGLASVIAEQSDLEIVVEGHTDTDQVRSTSIPRNNWELSVLRATAVVNILLENAGVDPSMLAASGRSEYHPVDTSDKGKNRRIEVILAPNLDSLYELISE